MPLDPSQIDWVPLSGIEERTLAIGVEGDPCSPLVLDSAGDSVGYLGAIIDPAGNPFEMVEIQIQETQHLAAGIEVAEEPIPNRQLEERWRTRLRFLTAGPHSRSLFRGPWEHEHPGPCLLDPGTGRMAEAGDGWTLCTDDVLLGARRLAPFSESPHRYLVDAGGERFIPLNDAAPRSPATLEFEEAFGGLIPINREAGLMLVKRLPQFAFPGFADFISGRHFVEEPEGLLRCPVADPACLALLKSTGPADSGFLHAKGEPSDRFSEVLYLKLSMLLEAFRRVAGCVAAYKTPMLGLTSDSFAVRLADPASSLPSFWNSRVELTTTPSAARIPLPNSEEQLVVPCEHLARSIYRSDSTSGIVSGTARARIRRMTAPDDHGLSIIEGTLETDEPVHPSRKDLLQFDLRFARGRRVTILANTVGPASDSGSFRFLSLPMEVPEELTEESARGGTQFVERVEFRILPRLGTAHDLFSLGVVACRILLHNGTSSLAETVDELLRLSAAYGATLDGSNWETGAGHLSDFIHSEKGREWRRKLGPNCLMHHLDPTEAASCVPARHWWKIVEFTARLFPGRIPGAFCRDLDDFDFRFPERVFEEPIRTLETLLDHTRTLLFDSPSASREILGVIRGFARRVGT